MKSFIISLAVAFLSLFGTSVVLADAGGAKVVDSVQATSKQEALNEAKKWLGFARGRYSNNEADIGYFREALKKADAKPEDVASSEEEIKILLKDGYVAEAKTWLGFARARFGNNEAEISNLRKYLEKAGVSLKAIGTSEREVKILLKDGYVAEAKKWLGFARERNGDNMTNLKYCLKFLEKSGVSPASIGLTSKVLYQLIADGFVAEAKKWQRIIDENPNSAEAGTYARYRDMAMRNALLTALRMKLAGHKYVPPKSI